MKYLESAVRFSIKNWKAALPLFILMVIPALINRTAVSLSSLTQIWTSISDPSQFSSLAGIMTFMGLVLPIAIGGGILSMLVQFVIMPSTYGLVNNGLETGNSDLNNIGQAISNNFVKYLMYFAGTLVLWLAFSVAAVILIGIFALLKLSVIVVLLLIAVGLAALVMSVLISLWYSAMVVDNLDVFAAVKKSIELVKSSFWTIIGIAVLVSIAGSVAGAVLGMLSFIPLLGTIIATAAPAAVSFIMIVFYLVIYREKTGRINAA